MIVPEFIVVLLAIFSGRGWGALASVLPAVWACWF